MKEIYRADLNTISEFALITGFADDVFHRSVSNSSAEFDFGRR